MKRITASCVAAFLSLGGLTLTAQAAEKLVISNWDNYMPPDVLERFTKETGIEVEKQIHATNDEIMGKVSASGGKGYDMLFISQSYVEALRGLGWLAEIDQSKIPNLKHLYPEALKLSYDPGLKHSAPYTWGTTGLCYRSDLMAAPTSWRDLFEPKDALKGKVTLLSEERWLLGSGLKTLGYSVNETDEKKLGEVKDYLIKAKSTMLAFDNTTFFSKLVSGEATLVHAWDGWCNYGTTENAAIKYAVPKEGTDTWVDSMVIMKSSANKEAAHKLINFILEPKTHAWTVENILFKVPSKAAMEAVNKDVMAKYPTLSITPAEMIANEQVHDVGPAQKLLSRLVAEIKAAQ